MIKILTMHVASKRRVKCSLFQSLATKADINREILHVPRYYSKLTNFNNQLCLSNEAMEEPTMKKMFKFSIAVVVMLSIFTSIYAVTAEEEDTYTVHIQIENTGIVLYGKEEIECSSACDYTVPKTKNVILRAHPDHAENFVEWQDENGEKLDEIAYTGKSEEITVIAIFKQ